MIPDQALVPTQTRATQYGNHARSLTQAIAAVVVTTQEQAEWAATTITDFANMQKGMETERDSVAKPLRAIAKKVSGWWKPGIDACDATIRHLKTQVQIFRNQEAAKQAEALREAATPQEVAQAVQVLAPVPVGLSERVDWGFEITDANQIPRDYFLLDEARIKREIRTAKGQITIPGIKVVKLATMVRS